MLSVCLALFLNQRAEIWAGIVTSPKAPSGRKYWRSGVWITFERHYSGPKRAAFVGEAENEVIRPKNLADRKMKANHRSRGGSFRLLNLSDLPSSSERPQFTQRLRNKSGMACGLGSNCPLIFLCSIYRAVIHVIAILSTPSGSVDIFPTSGVLTLMSKVGASCNF